MTKCNRTVCPAEGVYAHVDILFGHDGNPARYCQRCAMLINRACRPMAGHVLVPTDVSEVAEVLLARLGQPIVVESGGFTDWLRRTIAQHNAIAELGRRLLSPMPGAPEL